MDFEHLKGYIPEKIKDDSGFDAFKAKGRFGVNKARLDTKNTDKYTGEVVDCEFEMVDHAEFSGRRLWKMYFLESESSIKQLANVMHTCGMEFSNKEELQACLEKFSTMILKISAWPAKKKQNVNGEWVTVEPTEMVQQFKILGAINFKSL